MLKVCLKLPEKTGRKRVSFELISNLIVQEYNESIDCYNRIISKKKKNPQAFSDIYLGISFNELSHLLVDQSNFDKAYTTATESLVYFEKYYPKYYPLLGLQYLMCAKLASYLEEDGKPTRKDATSRLLFSKCFPILSTLFTNEKNQPFDLLIENNIIR